MKPSLSIVTICFNNLAELITTCRSVDEQTVWPDEHLIIDGSANEEILHWLQQQPQPSYRRWIHERDKGISDAFNKGIANARYEIIHLLNSGDHYTGKQSIETVMNTFTTDDSLMWVHSRYVQHRGGRDITSGVPFDKDQLWKGMRTVAHPGMFIKKQVYDRCGAYNINYKIAMDYDMLVRMRDEKFRFIPEALVYFAPGGASDLHMKKGLAEVRKIHRQHIGYSIKQNLWQWRQRLLAGFMKTSLGKKWFERRHE